MFNEQYTVKGRIFSNQPYSVELMTQLSTNITEELTAADAKFSCVNLRKNVLEIKRNYNLFRHFKGWHYANFFGVNCELTFGIDYKKNLMIDYKLTPKKSITWLNNSLIIVSLSVLIASLYFRDEVSEKFKFVYPQIILGLFFLSLFFINPRPKNSLEKLIQRNLEKAVKG